MSQPVVHIKNLNLKYSNKVVLKDLNWTIHRGENWILHGASGSGKTALAKILTGKQKAIGEVKINFDNSSSLPAQIFYVESWYQFKNVEGVANFYYQQRYTSWQAKETLTVTEELKFFGKRHHLDYATAESIMAILNFSQKANAQLIELSSGEHKKFQLIKALWLRPQVLILDQPYTGLDVKSRENLNILLNDISSKGVTLILIANGEDFPTCINRFALLCGGKINEVSHTDLQQHKEDITIGNLPDYLKESPGYSSDAIVKMVDINISYGDKKILKNIHWEVKKGEKWLLQGPNGSGKSTLLSLVNGDHPQAYANELYLFGKRRGSGESIWDIKERIGLISPEFHWYFDSASTVWQCVASGLYDNFGLELHLPFSKAKKVDELIEYFGITAIKNETLATLPLGKQRLVLLARTIIKNPELLILDEPCQGLDGEQTKYFNLLVDELCSNGMTLIYVGHYESELPATLEKKIVLENGEVKAIKTLKAKDLVLE
ncbi:ATP-binding cassette domain-containing protein [Pseudoxanthomonas sp. SGD-10]|nr:ATP-binding cassette domain-containing protein [Pseudoxanthomonas sp. SGD-10]